MLVKILSKEKLKDIKDNLQILNIDPWYFKYPNEIFDVIEYTDYLYECTSKNDKIIYENQRINKYFYIDKTCCEVLKDNEEINIFNII